MDLAPKFSHGSWVLLVRFLCYNWGLEGSVWRGEQSMGKVSWSDGGEECWQGVAGLAAKW